MIPTSLRTRLGLATAAVLLAGGLGAAGHAAATPDVPDAKPVDVFVDDEYWACIAIDHVEIGTCLENPLPDLSGLPSIPQLLDDLLGGLGQA